MGPRAPYADGIKIFFLRPGRVRIIHCISTEGSQRTITTRMSIRGRGDSGKYPRRPWGSSSPSDSILSVSTFSLARISSGRTTDFLCRSSTYKKRPSYGPPYPSRANEIQSSKLGRSSAISGKEIRITMIDLSRGRKITSAQVRDIMATTEPMAIPFTTPP